MWTVVPNTQKANRSINTENLAMQRPSKKLDWKQVGPFKVIGKVGNLAYRLKLPKEYCIHDVISVSRLEHSMSDTWDRPVKKPCVKLIVHNPVTNVQVNQIQVSDPY